MNYNLILEEIDDIYKIINLNKKILLALEEKEEILFKKSFNKNLTIEIYTFWENFCKELVYDCYSKYKKMQFNYINGILYVKTEIGCWKLVYVRREEKIALYHRKVQFTRDYTR